jgi:hypothetical protein
VRLRSKAGGGEGEGGAEPAADGCVSADRTTDGMQAERTKAAAIRTRSLFDGQGEDLGTGPGIDMNWDDDRRRGDGERCVCAAHGKFPLTLVLLALGRRRQWLVECRRWLTPDQRGTGARRSCDHGCCCCCLVRSSEGRDRGGRGRVTMAGDADWLTLRERRPARHAARNAHATRQGQRRRRRRTPNTAIICLEASLTHTHCRSPAHPRSFRLLSRNPRPCVYGDGP